MKSSGASASPKKRRGGRIVRKLENFEERIHSAQARRIVSSDDSFRAGIDRWQGRGDGIRPAKDRQGARGRKKRCEPPRQPPLPSGGAAGGRFRRRHRFVKAATERPPEKTSGRGNSRRRKRGPAPGPSCQPANRVRRNRPSRGGDGNSRNASVSRPSRARGSRARCAHAAPRSPGGSSPRESAGRQWHRSVAQTIPDRRAHKTTFNCKSNSRASVFGTQVDL